jgi:trimethylamine--corrinoid protein Co-methyltransferase
MPNLLDNMNIEQWVAEGSMDITERALKFAKSQLADYQEPKLEVNKNDELLDYIARRERLIPVDGGLNETY